jgi:hypothetical protein
MRACRTPDERLFAFVDGLDTDLDAHVAECDHCQEFLAELWVGELRTDLSDSVLRRIRFDLFLRQLGHLTADVAAAMGRALVEYGPGYDESAVGPEQASSLPASDDGEE